MKCVRDGVEMVEAVKTFYHGDAVLNDVKVLRCPVCGEEIIDIEEYGRIKSHFDSMKKR